VRGTKAELREQSAEAVASYSGPITRCLPKRRGYVAMALLCAKLLFD
jgi:hypothetical protein